MKRILLFLILISAFFSASAQTAQQKALADAYLEKYAEMAVEEMHRSGVPASITLAQGMLEIAAIEGQLGFVKFLGQIALHRFFVGKVTDGHFLNRKYMLGFAQVHLLHSEVFQLLPVAQHSNTRTEGLVRS